MSSIVQQQDLRSHTSPVARKLLELAVSLSL
jgi:hypothetical protein